MIRINLILKTLVAIFIIIIATACGKTEHNYHYHTLVYSIEREDGPTIHTFSFSGTDDAWAKVFLKEKSKRKWYELIASTDGGDEHTMMVTTSTFEIRILSFNREKNN